MTTKHTPGPWHVHDRCTRHMNDYRVCRVGPEENWHIVSHDVTKAPHRLQAQIDARLIAAAPELLAALQSLVAEIEYRTAGLWDSTEARAAIAKATGETL